MSFVNRCLQPGHREKSIGDGSVSVVPNNLLKISFIESKIYVLFHIGQKIAST